MKAFLVCYNCKRGHNYSIDDDFCIFCKDRILDPGIKELVFSLNNSGIKTERSCEGHEGSDWHYDFPWVVISFEKDLTKLEGIIDAYNSFVRPLRDLSLWEVSFNVEGLRYWLVPKEKQRTVVRLRKDSAYLAKFISKYSKSFCGVSMG